MYQISRNTLTTKAENSGPFVVYSFHHLGVVDNDNKEKIIATNNCHLSIIYIYIYIYFHINYIEIK